VSYDGSMMCTVEEKLSEMGLGGLMSLKFWARGSHTGHYTLSTVIYEPHRYGLFSSCYFLCLRLVHQKLGPKKPIT
jgi:NET1-associated nuclear protein 1 (U3 small nucleolar RNA-associated protein 17)